MKTDATDPCNKFAENAGRITGSSMKSNCLCLCLIGLCLHVSATDLAAQESEADVSEAMVKPTEIELDEPFTDIVIGGGGRYFCLHTVSSDRILIFDIKQKKMIGFIAGLTEDTIYCASQEFLLTFDNERGTITKWRLSDQKKVISIFSSFPGSVVCAGLGNDSHGPVMVGVSSWPRTRIPLHLLELDTLNEMPISQAIPQFSNAKIGRQLQSSADSTVFKLSRTEFSTGSTGSIDIKRYDDNDYKRPTNWFPLASGDKLISKIGFFELEEKKLTNWNYLAVIPSATGNYIIAIPPIASTPSNRGRSVREPSKELDSLSPICIFTGENPKQAKLPKIEFQLDIEERTYPPRISFDNRFFLLPDQKAIVTFPPERDSISIYDFDVKKILGESPERQPQLASENVTVRAYAETRFSYFARVSPTQIGLKYRLLSHPDGMTVSENGLVNWDVPSDFGAKSATADLSVIGPNGLDLKMKLTLAIARKETNYGIRRVITPLEDIDRQKSRFLNLIVKAKKGELSRTPKPPAVINSRKPEGKRFSTTDKTATWIGELVEIDDDGMAVIQLENGLVNSVPLNQLSVESAMLASELNTVIQQKRLVEESYIVNNKSLLDSVCDRFSEMIVQLEKLPIEEAITAVIYPDNIGDRNQFEITDEKRLKELREKYLRIVLFSAIGGGRLEDDVIIFPREIWLKKHDGVWKIGTGKIPVGSDAETEK